MLTNGFASHQRGMSLIEVMIAVFIMASGLLGLAALQSRSLVFAQSSFYRSVATDLAADLADRIRANRPPFLALNDEMPAVRPAALIAAPDFGTCVQNSTPDDPPTGCPTTFRVTPDMTAWNTAVRSQLVNGTWTLSSEATASGQGFRYTLTLTWLDDRGGNTNESYTTVIE
jgi:type IV pilus assembly protein PilV